MNILQKAKIMKYCKPNSNDYPINMSIPKNVTFIDLDNFEGFYFIQDDILYFFFNGSNDVKDWFDNFNTKRTKLYLNDTYCGKIHKGFFNYYENVKSTFIEVIFNNLQRKEIHLIGYSLGSTCTIAALDASFIQNCPPITVVTFGSPRIGNTTFSDIYNKRITNSFRIVNEHDPVTKVPAPCSYTHYEKLYLLTDNINYTSNWARFKDTLKYFFVKSAFVECHDIDEYINKLYKIPTDSFKQKNL